MARPPRKPPVGTPPARGTVAEPAGRTPARSATGTADKATPSRAPAASGGAAAPTRTTPDTATPTTPPTSAPSPAAALTAADVKLLRDRLDALNAGATVAGSTPADQLVAVMAAKLETARSADQARIATLEARVQALTAQVSDVTTKAAEQAATTSDERDAELRDALAVTDRLLADLDKTKASGNAAAADLAKAQQALARAEREAADLRAAADPKATGGTVLGPETVASLLNDFVGSFSGRLTGLGVASGEVSLKAGFAQLGQGAGFVLPSSQTPAAEQPVLHEIRLKLDPKLG